MSENEAIELLEYIRETGNGEAPYVGCAQNIAIDMGIKALERQIPKKPMHNGANWYRCPNGCEVHKKTFEKDWYCPKCGQALDWSE